MAELHLGARADATGRIRETCDTELGLNWVDVAPGDKRIVLDGEFTAAELRKIADWSELKK
jgi:hypothetical protein